MSACDEEPCKSLIGDYWHHAFDAALAQMAVRTLCEARKAALHQAALLFALWLATFASALACHALGLPDWLCAALTVAAMLLLAALFVWAVRIMVIDAMLKSAKAKCRRHYNAALSAVRAIAVRCPRECMPDWQRMSCDC